MTFDCAIVGGGPAGLNAALVLGRARRNVVLFDDGNPRNAVTRESHGFITRDGIEPGEFRRIAHRDISKYSSVQARRATIVSISRAFPASFQLVSQQGELFQARKVILATGLKEELPAVSGLRDYYGKSLFNCPYCDGWELRDMPLIVISEGPQAFHMAKTLFNWSKRLAVCTNGQAAVTREQKVLLEMKGIAVFERKIDELSGSNGALEKVVFEDGVEFACKGGFVTPRSVLVSSFGQSLGCMTNALGGIVTDEFGRTNIEGVYAAGDASVVAPSQVIIAAGEGSRAAIGVNSDLTNEDF
ncbi:NAD(P)/FAD-dependent oxidoreductase [Paenibacillus sp. MBLB4367]|uniref:NAD(P)/FAD-dependent oxidoreductase n=1 Tax=Paenibacillus sp. MBLB4367 TaxID=3384767 RepID=UPI0039083598